jgi:hypothetical protein
VVAHLLGRLVAGRGGLDDEMVEGRAVDEVSAVALLVLQVVPARADVEHVELVHGKHEVLCPLVPVEQTLLVGLQQFPLHTLVAVERQLQRSPQVIDAILEHHLAVG